MFAAGEGWSRVEEGVVGGGVEVEWGGVTIAAGQEGRGVVGRRGVGGRRGKRGRGGSRRRWN